MAWVAGFRKYSFIFFTASRRPDDNAVRTFCTNSAILSGAANACFQRDNVSNSCCCWYDTALPIQISHFSRHGPLPEQTKQPVSTKLHYAIVSARQPESCRDHWQCISSTQTTHSAVPYEPLSHQSREDFPTAKLPARMLKRLSFGCL